MATWISNCSCPDCCNRQRIPLTANSGETFAVVPEGWTLTEDGVLVAPDGSRHIPRRNTGFFRGVQTIPRRGSSTLLPGEYVGPPNPPVGSLPNESFYQTYYCPNLGDANNSVTVLIPADVVRADSVAQANILAIAMYEPLAEAQLNCDAEACSAVLGVTIYNTEPFVQVCEGGTWYSDPWEVSPDDGWTENVHL